MTPRQQFMAWLDEHNHVGHVRDAGRFGMSKAAIAKAWRRNGWPQPMPGVLASPGAEMTYERRVLVATTWVGGDVVATGLSALSLRGLADPPDRRIWLAVPHSRRNRRTDSITVHRSDLAFEAERDTIGFVPTVEPAWALRDHATFAGTRSLQTLIIRALQRNGTSLRRLEEVLASHPTGPGMPEFGRVLDVLRRDRVDSGLELDTRALARGAGYEPWPAPFPFRCPDGRVIHLDVPFPGIWFAIECDDPTTHGSLRSFSVDRTRWGQAMRGGWRLAFSWRARLERDPQGLVEEIAEAFTAADPDRPPPVPAHDCTRGCTSF